jgi:hypothetical protein
MLNHKQILQRVKWLTWFFIIGLVIAGVTAIPLKTELDWMARMLGGAGLIHEAQSTGFAHWIFKVHEAIRNSYFLYPFMAYGTDWLAFGHFVIALAFVGPLRDPVRNRWLYLFGMISCVAVIPYAFTMGAVRGIPIYWRLIDCSFGVVGFFPLWFCWRWTGELELVTRGETPVPLDIRR